MTGAATRHVGRDPDRPAPESRTVIPETAFADLLERAGFQVRGRRAGCPYCEGHSRLTVSFTDEVFYCHRCHRSGNGRTLARELGLPLAPETHERREQREQAARFSEWKETCHLILGRRLRCLTQRAEDAKRVLAQYPGCESAWNALAAFYHNEAEIFGALDVLAFEKVSQWLESPLTRDTLFVAFADAQKGVSRAA